MAKWILIAGLSYLLGSIPFGYLLVRIFRGEDVRQSGSGNIGATNVSRKSPMLGALTLLLDALKGSAAVAVALMLSRAEIAHWTEANPAAYATLFYPLLASMATARGAVAALLAILGHMFPVWLKFRGGKGVATGLGAFVVLAPKAVLAAVGVFALVVAISRHVSLGSILAALSLPILAWVLHDYGDVPLLLVSMTLTSLLIVAKHHENIRRLLAGTEGRIGAGRK